MLQFILGLLIGCVIGFTACAIFSMSSSSELDAPCKEETGDSDDRK